MSNIDTHTFADDESGKTFFIHPAAFGSTKNPGYGHVAVVKAEDFDNLRAKLDAAEKRNADLEGLLEAEVRLWTQRYDCANSRREAAEKRIAELQSDEVRQRLANAEHQLHMAELAKHNLRASRKAQFRKRKAAERRIAELEVLEELFLRAKVLMHQSGGAPIENSLNPIDAWLYDAEHAAAGKGVAS